MKALVNKILRRFGYRVSKLPKRRRRGGVGKPAHVENSLRGCFDGVSGGTAKTDHSGFEDHSA